MNDSIDLKSARLCHYFVTRYWGLVCLKVFAMVFDLADYFDKGAVGDLYTFNKKKLFYFIS